MKNELLKLELDSPQRSRERISAFHTLQLRGAKTDTHKKIADLKIQRMIAQKKVAGICQLHRVINTASSRNQNSKELYYKTANAEEVVLNGLEFRTTRKKIVEQDESIPVCTRTAKTTPRHFSQRLFLRSPIKNPNTELIQIKNSQSNLLSDPKLQGFILSDELDILSSKIFNIKYIFAKGIKKSIQDVLAKLPIISLNSLNLKLLELISKVYEISLKLVHQPGQEIGPEKVQKAFDEFNSNPAKKNKFKSNVSFLYCAYELFEKIVRDYQIISKRTSFQPLSKLSAKKMQEQIETARFIVTSLYEEYQVMEESIETTTAQRGNKSRYLSEDKKQTIVSKQKKHNVSIARLSAASISPQFEEKKAFRHVQTERKMRKQALEGEELDSVINKCLHKIFYPSKNSRQKINLRSSNKKTTIMEQYRKNNESLFLSRSIRILKQGSFSNNPTVQVNVGNLIRKLEKDYFNVLL